MVVTLLLQWNQTTTVPESCHTSDCGLAACQGFGVMVRGAVLPPNIWPAEVTFSKTLCSAVGLYWTLTLSCLENDDVKTETLNQIYTVCVHNNGFAGCF